ncbi:hypothetical protein YYC_01109 [Plasmodium yoelii 17X]|uniref:Fam-c protein n=3 Tax=Plasmodium yoelii TaxID=5861 RepID=A0AAE9WPC6_PLAYO|nr:fam-c protein [Plasmodium yoelii]ETB62125.1 hypothetical protein YYC_01109 [Plasmodium yoelii 17X]WBY54632.1 fam-c protein [Plasmodium yoelii yoelii]CDS44770.1 fam-c protein [Plasmodium yoelii]VTZ71626.1 fam-c protein [Plasmodium yoelii]|eukprot:XP_728486.2 fam-c protein [Plasmodium yoelii]
MNKRIFSLVCIVIYSLLAVPIHCSEQKVSDVRNKSIRGTKERNKSNEQNDIESKRETQLKNNNSKDEDDRGFNCFNIFKRNKKNKRTKVSLTHSCNQTAGTSSNNNDSIPNLIVRLGKIQHAFPVTDPELLKLLLLLKEKLEIEPSNNNKYISKGGLQMQQFMDLVLVKNPEALEFLSHYKKSIGIKPSNDKEPVPKITLLVKNIPHDVPVKDPEHLKFFLRLKEELENYHQIENQENNIHIIIIFK